MQFWPYRLLVFPFLLVLFASIPDVQAQAPSDHQNVANEMSVTSDPRKGMPMNRGWESPEGRCFQSSRITLWGRWK